MSVDMVELRERGLVFRPRPAGMGDPEPDRSWVFTTPTRLGDPHNPYVLQWVEDGVPGAPGWVWSRMDPSVARVALPWGHRSMDGLELVPVVVHRGLGGGYHVSVADPAESEPEPGYVDKDTPAGARVRYQGVEGVYTGESRVMGEARGGVGRRYQVELDNGLSRWVKRLPLGTPWQDELPGKPVEDVPVEPSGALECQYLANHLEAFAEAMAETQYGVVMAVPPGGGQGDLLALHAGQLRRAAELLREVPGNG